MTEECHVYFAVFGFDAAPMEITLLAGVEPDICWSKGDPITPLEPDAKHRQSRWLLCSGLDRYASYQDHFEKLYYRLRSLGDRLGLLRNRYRCGLGVSQYFYVEDAGFYLPDHLIADYEALGIPLSFDQLCLDSPLVDPNTAPASAGD